MGQPWTPEDIKRLDSLVRAGASVPELCETFGRTRWAIISKTRQMHLRVSKVSTRTKASASTPVRPVRAPPPPMPTRPTAKDLYFARMVPVLSEDHRPWETREFGECAAPVTMEDGTVHSCCRPVYTAKNATSPSSYCKEHHRLFFQPVKIGPRDMARATQRLRP